MDPFAATLATSREDAVLFQDAQGRTLFTNRRWEDLVAGIPAAPAHIALTSRFVHDEVVRAQAKFAESEATGQAIRFQSRLSEGLDAGPWVAVSRLPVFAEPGVLMGWVTSVEQMATHLNPVDLAGLERNAENRADRLLHIGALDWSVATGPMWWSEGVYEILGLDSAKDEASYERFLACVHPEDRDELTRHLQLALEGHRHFDVRHRVIQPDGTILLVRDQGDVERDELGAPVRLLSTIQDITDEVVEDRLRERSGRALATLLAGNAALVHSTDEASLLNQMCTAAVEAGGYSLAWYGRILHDGSFGVVPLSAAGPATVFLDDLTLTGADEPSGAGAVERAAHTGLTVVVDDAALEPGFEHWADRARQFHLNTVVALPVRVYEQVDGVLVVYASDPEAFGTGSVGILEELAIELGFGLERLASVQRTNDALESTIRVLAATVELRDPYTAGHQMRVAELAVAIGREMGATEFDLRGLHLAGLIHDIGKVSVPTELLTRPGTLRPVELELIRGHAAEGEALLSTIEFPWPIATIVGQHHERLDGSGYPRGLHGDQILLPARILAVADVVEAMSRFRPYREALGVDAAVAEITLYSGTLFDPAVVDACIIVLAGGFTFDSVT